MAEKSNSEKSILEVNHDDLTPGMKQYREVKQAHPDCLVMLRMGDFYEMFYQDAATASRELEITLTARGTGERRAPLAGVPFHALETYLGRLVKKGYKVAIVEQLEDPKKTKKLVKRGLVRIVTPGTVMESTLLNEKENNYVMALTVQGEEYTVAFCDLSTGEFFTSPVSGTASLFSEMNRYTPSECIIPTSLRVNQELLKSVQSTGCFVTAVDDNHFSLPKTSELIRTQFSPQAVEVFGLQQHPSAIAVSGALLKYLMDTQKTALSHIKRITLRTSQHHMLLDSSTFRNLELTRNIIDGSNRGTLLSVLDQTVTAVGARLLKKWLKEPLLDREQITHRLDAVQVFTQQSILREELRVLLKEVADMERLIGRLNYGNAHARELLSLQNSLQQIPLISERLSTISGSELLQYIKNMPSLSPISTLISTAICDDAPLTLREGGMIKFGYHQELDQLHDIKKNSRKYLQELEEKEKYQTGISTLRLGYNRIFGYFIEVTRKQSHLVPAYYIRKQTTVNTERYITEELKREEEKILGAEEKINELEYEIIQRLIQQTTQHTAEIQEAAAAIALLDVLCSLAKVAVDNRYVRPEFTDDHSLHIESGRHPVIEQRESRFIGNDVTIHPGEMMIITGPNMAGKSTLMRQVALIILLAQTGSFVPAERARLSIVDRIFTRVGAYDDLSSGQSTFMVEMSETAAILQQATDRSLIILDEIGRGTSTFDGVSIAWSVAEYIIQNIKAKTLFSTHYHVLNKLAERFSKIKNYNVAVREVSGEVIFLRKLIEGGTDQSYGIHVAKLAGLPHSVIERAAEIQSILEKDDEMMRKIKAKKIEEQRSLEAFHSPSMK